MDEQPPLVNQDVTVTGGGKTVYAEGFEDLTADVIIHASDGVAFRVHDYYLKASSQFFRDLLEAGTKGGPIPLDATGPQLCFLMDILVGRPPKKQTLRVIAEDASDEATSNKYHILSTLIELHGIAEKYLLHHVSLSIRDIIADYANTHPPLALIFACRQSPPHKATAYNALRAFTDGMPGWMEDYFDGLVDDYEECPTDYWSPSFDSISMSFARDLGGEAVLAYGRAMNTLTNDISKAERERENELRSCVHCGQDQVTGRENKAKCGGVDWAKMAQAFIQELGIARQGVLEASDSDSDSNADTEEEAESDADGGDV